MKPIIDKTVFGEIVIEGYKYEYDIMIRLSGAVEKRKKKLSKEIYGTSHIISIHEAKYVYEEGAQQLVIGGGHDGMVKLSDEAAAYFQKKGCKVDLSPTPQALEVWNNAKGKVIGLFHVTC
jgi:hypothetical protein